MIPHPNPYRDPARWPSTQRASEMLARRMAAQLRLRAAREMLAAQFEFIGRRAA